MSQDPEKELIPEDESVAALNDNPEKKENPSAPKEETKENLKKIPEERIRLENEAYEKHFSELIKELESIREKFPSDSSEKTEDPVKKLFVEFDQLKNSFSELKEMMRKHQQTQNSNSGFQSTFQYSGNPVFTQGAAQPYYPPMFQTSTIMPAPALPFIQTPNFAPTITMPPVSGNNMNSNGGNNHV